MASDATPAEARWGNGDPLVGSPYRTLRLIGRGGMGDVFLVEHLELGKRMAAKLLHAKAASNPQLIDRIRLEAQALGRLHHANIVEVYDFRTTRDGRPFIVMELLRGRSVSEELRARGNWGPFEAVDCMRQVLAALSAAHAIGIVHRDIKPGNLFIHQGPGSDRNIVKVIDFGIAKVIEGVSEAAPAPLAVPTDTGVVVGTPRFLSPEAALNRAVDHRADLYAVGVVLYTLLAGRGPFDHIAKTAKVISAHAHEPPSPPSHYAQEPIPAELDRLVLKALSKDPAERYQNATEFDRELEMIIRLLARPKSWDKTAAFDPLSVASSDAGPEMVVESKQRGQKDARSGQRDARSSDDSTTRTAVTPGRRTAMLLAIFVIVSVVVALLAAGLVALVTSAGT